MATTTTCIIYCRISLDMAKMGEGVDRQLHDCRELAERLGVKIVGEYIDNDTGASKLSKSRRRGGRPQFEAAKIHIGRGGVNALITWNLDRLLRDPDELSAFIDLSSDGKFRIHSGGSLIDLTTPQGVHYARMLVANAELEVAMMSKRIKDANRGRRNNGVMTFRRRCFGYAGKMNGVVYPEGAKVGDVIPTEAALIREMAKRAIDGASQMSIAMWLNDAGVLTAGGGRWQSAGVKSLLESARVVGWVEYDGVYVKRGNWEPIITREIQDAVKVAFHQRTRGKPGPRAMLTGIVVCSVCGRSMNRGVGGNGTATYRCSPRPDRGTGCGNVMVAHAVEGFVRDYVFEFAPKLHAATLKRVKIEKLTDDVAKIQRAMDELDVMLDVGDIDDDRWAERHRRLHARLKAAREAEGKSREVQRERQLAGNLGTVTKRWGDLSDDGKRGIIAILVKSVTISPAKRRGGPVDWDRIEIEPTETLATILTAA